MRTFAEKSKSTQQTTSVQSAIPRRSHFGQSPEVKSILNQQMPVHAPVAGTIPAKLTVNTPGDIYEEEADRVSRQVMSTPEPQLHHARGEACPTSQTKQPGQEQDRLTAKRIGPRDMEPTAAPPIVHNVLGSAGQPLNPATRAFMEPRFGHDFSEVRVHTDANAAESARAVNAIAYTVGRDVVFGTGRYAPGSTEGTRLLAHELTHVVQQAGAGPSLQRQPKPPQRDVRPETKSPQPSPNDSAQKLTPFVTADLVQELKRDNETWMLTIDGFTKPESVTRVIWPRFVPPGITITADFVLTEPIERGTFILNGITVATVDFMEPSFAKLFTDRGLVADAPESTELRDARNAFIKRHSDYSDAVLYNIVVALNRIAKRNPELLVAYYKYYADNNLRDEQKYDDHISDKDYNPDKNTGATAYGGTIINPKVLDKTSKFQTDDPISLLAGTLIHEYVHTPQGGGGTIVSGAPQEAKAYGIELFFSERMGDKKRAVVINDMSWSSSVDVRTGADKIFYQSHDIMMALYKVIDQGGPAAKEAREMSVEFISQNEEDYGKKLKAFISKQSQ